MGSFTYGQSKHELFESELNCMHVSESVKSDSIYKMMNNDTLSDCFCGGDQSITHNLH